MSLTTLQLKTPVILTGGFNPNLLLWIKQWDEADLTTDEDLEGPSNHPPPTRVGLSSRVATGQRNDVDRTEEEEDNMEMVMKMQPIDYSAEVPSSSAQSIYSVAQPVSIDVQPCASSQISPVSTKPAVFTTKPPVVPAKPLSADAKPCSTRTKRLPPAKKRRSVGTKLPLLPNQPSSLNTPVHQPDAADPGSVSNIVRSFRTAQRNYHQSQRHQMHVVHMDLLHLGAGVHKLSKIIKVSEYVRESSRARILRMRHRDFEELRYFRGEKLLLLREHYAKKQRIMKEHYNKQEKLIQEQNQVLQRILRRLSDPAAAILAEASAAAAEET
ncbi:uncharacterized protein LOC134949627 isoform X2 [Pseudophryne corroboree]|uniref:uncharacterized protein LOC134949627 isoform X2 n=1 Tax=Pseudophryne corroboree TaxID=495146 RepID=UPI0030819659